MEKLNLQEVRQMVSEHFTGSLLESPELLDEKSILKNKHPFKAVFMFGPAGAGKGYILKNVLTGPNGSGTRSLLADFTTANPDERIEEVFPIFGVSTKFVNSAETSDAVDLDMLQQKARLILQIVG